ncbi:MAG: YezD family protein [Candidatus Omnitrophica bacterium]|nr:YezD family protein [Candidatus Omnitrophota bacterium]
MNKIEPTIIEEIKNYLEKIRFGELVITLHEGRVVQIEKREKKRFNLVPTTKVEADL